MTDSFQNDQTLGNDPNLKRILVVAPGQFPRLDSNELAAELKATIIQAYDINEATQACKTHQPDIIILPVSLHEETTLPFMRACLKQNSNIQVLLILNRDQINQAAEAMRAGVVDCLFRPFTFSRLKKTISSAIQRVDNVSKGTENSAPISAAVNNTVAPTTAVAAPATPNQVSISAGHDQGDDFLKIARQHLRDFTLSEGGNLYDFEPEALHLLLRYSWPENIREMVDTLRQIVVEHGHSSNAHHVTVAMLPSKIKAIENNGADISVQSDTDILKRLLKGQTLAQTERLVIEAAIETADGSIARAAKALDVAPSTLYRKLQGWGIPASDTDAS